ncbi:cytochrome b/b6 domain-containing protein [Nitrincola alkalilacustris]|uniref:cytochrome b/b6 domain-containing protein n=1 Tax=Nitrincola alkalilacustris TaxID=1571224 RepID=UPI0014578E67|nr:cytochrome b/b6 domain-containing protein [Nitrincola alkalilacustris]
MDTRTQKAESSTDTKQHDLTPVWDLFTRAFHWLLVAALAVAWWTGDQGDFDLMEWHMIAGYTVLGLILFRVIWGIIGSHYSRFGQFSYSPITTLTYLRQLLSNRAPTYMGHNPLGSWMVYLLLLLSATQAGLGLFASDDIFIEGPLARSVDSDTVRLMTSWHKTLVDYFLLAVGLHLLGVAYHQFIKREPLVQAMIHGRKPADMSEPRRPFAPVWLGTMIACLSAAIIWYAVNRLF